MTTYVPFVPSAVSPPQFQATLDGQLCTVVVSWNLFGQRYYVAVYDSTGTLIVNRALVGSPPDYDINLVGGGYFTTATLVFRTSTQQFEVGP